MDNDTSGHGRSGRGLYKALAKALYLTLGLIAVIWFSYTIRYVLLASVLALIVAVALNVPVTALERRSVPRAVGTALTFIGLFLIAGLVGWLVVPQLTQEVSVLLERVPELVEGLAGQLAGILGESAEVQRQMGQLVDRMLGLFEEIWRYTDEIAGMAALALFVTALALYMVVYLRSLLGWYIRSLPPRFRDPATRAFSRSSRMVLGWIYGTVILGGIKAVAIFIFLTAVGAPGVVVWTFVAFLGAFVPQVGFYLAAIPPVLMILSEDPMLALWTFVYYAVFSEILGRFVAPWIYAESMELNPVYVLFMIVAIGYAFGIVGVLMATPVAGFMKAHFDEFYLARQPEVEELEDRIDAMMKRKTGWEGGAPARREA